MAGCATLAYLAPPAVFTELLFANIARMNATECLRNAATVVLPFALIVRRFIVEDTQIRANPPSFVVHAAFDGFNRTICASRVDEKPPPKRRRL